MNTLVNALREETNYAHTDNGALTHESSLNACLDFFFVGPVAKKNPQDAVNLFRKAYAENPELSLRVLQWVRDARGGAGARQAFRDCFAYLMDRNADEAISILNKVAEIGRWDDVLVGLFSAHKSVQTHVIEMVKDALFVKKDGLCAKWLPRKGDIALALRKQLNLSPKNYRKTLVELSSTVEQKMCAKNWDGINYSHVPSVAFARYREAFKRNDDSRYSAFVDKANKGEVKVNASAIFPHDIVKGLLRSPYVDLTTRNAINSQWKNLPNYLEDSGDTGLVVADVSMSMTFPVSGSSTALDVCIAMAMYIAERAKGPFKDTFITFSDEPTLQTLKGDIVDRYNFLKTAKWDMSTNVEKVFSLILNTAIKNNVVAKDMPKFITILSDMEFNVCTNGTALDTIKHKYEKAGYEFPKLIFWNLQGRTGNIPAKASDTNVALVSGYSPAVAKEVFSGDYSTPVELMLKTVMVDRYDLS